MKPSSCTLCTITTSIVLLLLGSQALAEENLCTRLGKLTPNDDNWSLFIIAIGYAGKHFYLIANDFTGYTVKSSYAFFNDSVALVNLAKGKPLKIATLDSSGAPVDHVNYHYHVIGYVDKTAILLMHKMTTSSKDVIHTLVKLEESEPKEAKISLEYNYADVPNPYMYGGNVQGKFYLQSAQYDLVEGEFSGLSGDNEFTAHVDFNQVLGRINSPSVAFSEQPHTGVVVQEGRLLYAINNHEKAFELYKLGSDEKSSKKVSSIHFGKVLDCTGKVWKEVAPVIPKKGSNNTSEDDSGDNELLEMLKEKILPICLPIGLLLLIIFCYCYTRKSKDDDMKSGKEFRGNGRKMKRNKRTAGRQSRWSPRSSCSSEEDFRTRTRNTRISRAMSVKGPHRSSFRTSNEFGWDRRSQSRRGGCPWERRDLLPSEDSVSLERIKSRTTLDNFKSTESFKTSQPKMYRREYSPTFMARPRSINFRISPTAAYPGRYRLEDERHQHRPTSSRRSSRNFYYTSVDSIEAQRLAEQSHRSRSRSRSRNHSERSLSRRASRRSRSSSSRRRSSRRH